MSDSNERNLQKNDVKENIAKDRNNYGVAAVKSNFIIQDHGREVNLEFVSKSDKHKIEEDDKSSAPPKKKLKGSNKQRQQKTRIPKDEKLCLKFLSENSCPYGTSCCFSHNVDSFLARKPPDLGATCYIFRNFGKCPYSFTCRFSSQHLSADNKSIINHELYSKKKDIVLTLNALPKNLQVKLRKKSYDFSKSTKVLKLIADKTYKNIIRFEGPRESTLNGAEIAKTIDRDTKECFEESVILEHVTENESVPTSKETSDVVEDELKSTCDGLKTEKGICNSEEDNVKEREEPPSLLIKTFGPVTDEEVIRMKLCEKKKIDFRDQLFLSPLTTVGNLPFRRICKELGADITCGEMAMALNLLQGQQSEWALLRRHHTETVFGVQICGAHVDIMTRCAQMLTENVDVDFVDINMGCPLDLVYQKGAGSGLIGRLNKMEEIVVGMSSVLDVPLTVKMRKGIHDNKNTAHNVINRIKQLGERVALITLHGRSREQRYTKLADWEYINYCAKEADPIPLFGNGDILSFEEANLHRQNTNVSGIMIARGALIKPWIFTEIKEQRHWDISSTERYDIIKRYVNYGLEHWGSDDEGVEKTRRFLLEWLSFLHRYIPIGLLERIPQKINERPPLYRGRDDLETLMASPSCADWVKISEMMLGPVPEQFTFLPKHKANAYQ
ncbi:LOW QUALITY PROTEIN: tRNA-dihydrouridine(47) synthase [NAD(P)(+)]-like [Tachypleus tridentatus]|uniref:LOW QUALITY PROTEIN: tRNA-dihydrouridine(47) synthase [NAD(P)(+)]-like n=1 Tax=Tachypleus tridentatus TaxID=6853 RepID=UPI003FD23EC3